MRPTTPHIQLPLPVTLAKNTSFQSCRAHLILQKRRTLICSPLFLFFLRQTILALMDAGLFLFASCETFIRFSIFCV